MSKAVKVWLTIATVLVVLGVLIFGVVMTMNHWDFSRLGTVKYETNTYEFDETFQDLSIHTDVADLLFVPSDDETCKVVCYERQMMHHNVEVKNGTLYIRPVDANAWYEFIGITLETPKITVYLPQKAYNALVIDGSVGTVELPDAFSFETVEISGDTSSVLCRASVSKQLKIELDVGDMQLENLSAGSLNLTSDTGDVTVTSVTCAKEIQVEVDTGSARLTNVQCGSLTAIADTGDLLLEQVTATDAMTLQSEVGAVQFDGCDAGELYIVTDTGDVTGTLLSEKVFLVESDTGDIDVPKTVTGGVCEIRTDTGDVQITLK